MDPIILSVGVLLVASLFGRKKKRRRPQLECAPFPWLGTEVDIATKAGVAADICELRELASHVADVVYPMDMNDRKIEWPKGAPWHLPASEPPAVQCLWDRIMIRVQALLATEIDAQCPPPGPINPADVVGPWISEDVEPGRFYRIQSGDNPTTVARRLMQFMTRSSSKFVGHPLTDDVMRAMVGAWNLTYFGSVPAARDKTCGTFQAERLPTPYWAVDTDDGPRDITQAFCPKHEDAIEAMFAGRLPNRTIDARGDIVVGGPMTWGVLWIPAMEMEVINDELTLHTGATWSDGSTMGAPPPEVLEVLS